MNDRFAMRVSAILVLAVALLAAPLAFAAEKPLSNADIVKLSKLGLSEEAITAKIRQATEVDFALETDDLGKLKAAGVSGSVIAAMLDRVSGGGGTTIVAPGIHGAVITTGSIIVKLVMGDGKAVVLPSLVGSPSSTYAYVTMLNWENFPGLRAENRTPEHSPGFLLITDKDPRSRYYIVRLDVNDKDGDRSLKMGKAGMFSFKAGTIPDSDWIFPFDSVEEKKGTWRLSLKKPLQPGEYGIYAMQEGELFDFGID